MSTPRSSSRSIQLLLVLVALPTLVLLPARAPTAWATVPGANGRILYDGPALRTVGPDGHDKLVVAQDGSEGAWSPDGRRIVFVKLPSSGAELWTTNANGSGKRLLIGFVPPVKLGMPAWSPNGSTIVFQATIDDPDPTGCWPCNWELYSVSRDGTGLTRLTFSPGIESDPEFSPDGSSIVLARSSQSGNLSGIYIMNADGSDLRLVNDQVPGAFSPSWSPDGTRIAFSGSRRRTDLPQVFVMHADGARLHAITPLGEFSQMPSWSPDGTMIVYIHQQSPAGVWVMGADGSDPHTLTPGAGDRFRPKWGPAA